MYNSPAPLENEPWNRPGYGVSIRLPNSARSWCAGPANKDDDLAIADPKQKAPYVGPEGHGYTAYV